MNDSQRTPLEMKLAILSLIGRIKHDLELSLSTDPFNEHIKKEKISLLSELYVEVLDLSLTKPIER